MDDGVPFKRVYSAQSVNLSKYKKPELGPWRDLFVSFRCSEYVSTNFPATSSFRLNAKDDVKIVIHNDKSRVECSQT